MGVIFDQVEGHVEPAATPITEENEAEASPAEPYLVNVRYEMSRLAEREARLRAD